jgi:HSP20 family protein
MSTLIARKPRIAPRLSPWADFETFQNRINRIMGRAAPDMFPEDPMAWAPAIDLEEKEDEFVLTAEFPGMTEKDVSVDVEQNVLTLKGEKKTEREETKEKNGRWHLVERSWGAFERSFTLPSTVDLTAIKAGMESGLLTVHMPKRKASAARRIPIGSESSKAPKGGK